MTSDEIQRYQRDNDFYNALADQYGYASADFVAGEAQSGDDARLRNALSAIRSASHSGISPAVIDATANNRPTGTLGIFIDQITSDPLAAPLDAANRQLSNVVKNVVGNPMVLIVVIGIVLGLVVYFGGLGKIKARFA